jgi:hypothetical protein
MIIKLLHLFEDDKNKGFELNKEYTVNKVQISGDYCAYDIWYYITNELNNATCFMDLNVEEVGKDKRLDKFIANFNDFLTFNNNNTNIPYKFQFELHMDCEESEEI